MNHRPANASGGEVCPSEARRGPLPSQSFFPYCPQPISGLNVSAAKIVSSESWKGVHMRFGHKGQREGSLLDWKYPICLLAMIVVGLGSFVALATPAQDGSDDSAAQPVAHPAPAQNGISSVTDGAGNPVPRDTFAGPPPAQSRESLGGAARPEVQRGQTWWPYRTALPPYTSVNMTAEAMSENQIMVNGVALLSVDAPGSGLPADAEGARPRSRQPAQPGGRLLPRQDQGVHPQPAAGRRPRGGGRRPR